MDLKQQYLEEKQQNKEERIKRIIEVAKIEFAKNGIVNTKLSIIAREAHVGEATIYRYFTDKIQLIKLVALDYWKNQVIIFKNYLDENIEVDSDGLSKVKVYLDIFIELYHSHKNFLKFMEDFDNFYILSQSPNEVNEFIQSILHIKNLFTKLFDEGLEDGSIKPDFDKEIAYSFLSQVMVSTTQKMALRLGYTHTDNTEYAVSCLSTTIDMFIQYITNKNAK